MAENEQDYTSFRIAVPTEFETVFSHFYFAENKSKQSLAKVLLPSFQTILLFCFGNKAWLTTKQNTIIEVKKCLVLGPIKQSFEYTISSNTSILVVNFKDDAFYRFFGTSIVSEHFPVNPDEFLDENCFTNLWHELTTIHSLNEQVNYILEFCRPYLKSQNTTTALLSNFKDTTLNPIKSIAQKINQSERNVQLKHKEQFGYSSKEITRYSRFLNAIKIIETNIKNCKEVEWFEIIEQCNYYDQSQLIHDFKHFINISPTKYLKFQQDICNPKSE